MVMEDWVSAIIVGGQIFLRISSGQNFEPLNFQGLIFQEADLTNSLFDHFLEGVSTIMQIWVALELKTAIYRKPVFTALILRG